MNLNIFVFYSKIFYYIERFVEEQMTVNKHFMKEWRNCIKFDLPYLRIESGKGISF